MYLLDLHEEFEEERNSVASYLRLNEILSAKPGVNLFRTLIFGQSISGWDNHNPISVFAFDSENKCELEKWLGRVISPTDRNDILDSLLVACATAEEGGIKQGWGADSRNHVHKLPLLRDTNDEWTPLGELCFDVSDKLLSELFNKTAISNDHKELLGVELLTAPIKPEKNDNGGLGITHQIEETDIIEKLETLPSTGVVQTRMSILKMMLESKKIWSLEGELPNIRWIPAMNGHFYRFDELYLPTPEPEEIVWRRAPTLC